MVSFYHSAPFRGLSLDSFYSSLQKTRRIFGDDSCFGDVTRRPCAVTCSSPPGVPHSWHLEYDPPVSLRASFVVRVCKMHNGQTGDGAPARLMTPDSAYVASASPCGRWWRLTSLKTFMFISFFFFERVNEAAAVIKIKGAEPLVLLLIVSVQSQM